MEDQPVWLQYYGPQQPKLDFLYEILVYGRTNGVQSQRVQNESVTHRQGPRILTSLALPGDLRSPPILELCEPGAGRDFRAASAVCSSIIHGHIDW